MNWDAIGAIGEVLAAIGVIVTLFYLALQVRHGKQATEANTKSLEDSRKYAEIELHRNSQVLAAPLAEWPARDESLAKILVEGFEDYQALNKIDRFRFTAVMTSYVLGFKGIMEAFDRGIMDADTYTIWLSAVAAFVTTPGGEVWWKTGQLGFIPELRQRINDVAEGNSSKEFQTVVSQMLSENTDVQ